MFRVLCAALGLCGLTAVSSACPVAAVQAACYQQQAYVQAAYVAIPVATIVQSYVPTVQVPLQAPVVQAQAQVQVQQQAVYAAPLMATQVYAAPVVQAQVYAAQQVYAAPVVQRAAAVKVRAVSVQRQRVGLIGRIRARRAAPVAVAPAAARVSVRVR